MKERIKNITIFGSSQTVEGEKLYETARKLGGLLAKKEYKVINGGYGGVMEAVSRGVAENNGEVTGIIVEDFTKQKNSWLTETVPTEDIYSRIRELIARGDAYVVLDGKAGTLNEMVFLWALKRMGNLRGKNIYVVGTVWSKVVKTLKENNVLGSHSLENTILIDGPEDILEEL